MNNSSDNIVGNCPFPQNFPSHSLMTNQAAAMTTTTTNFQAPADVLTSNSNIMFDVTQMEGAMTPGHTPESREYKTEQVESPAQHTQLISRMGNPPVESSFPHSFYQIHPGE